MTQVRWGMVFLTISVLAVSPAGAQAPKKSAEEVVGVFLGGGIVATGKDTTKKWANVVILLMKDDAGRYLIFKKGTTVRITPDPKLAKNLLEPGARIAVTVSAGDPSSIVAIDIRQEAKGKREDFDWEQKITFGNGGASKDGLVFFERPDGRLLALRLDKNTTVTAGRWDENLAEVKPGRFMCFFPDKGKLLGIAMFPEDGVDIDDFRKLGIRVVRDDAATTALTFRVGDHGIGRWSLAPEVAAKAWKDLGQMSGLRSLTIGRTPARTKQAKPLPMPVEQWNKTSEQLMKLRTPFALELRVDFTVGSRPDELKELATLTVLNPESDIDLAALKKMPAIQSLTLAVDNDADLAKAVTIKSLTGLILEPGTTGKLSLTPAGMKQLKKATNLAELVVRSPLIADAALREVKDLPKLRTLVAPITDLSAKDIKKNTKLTTLVVSGASDASLKDLCDIKGLQDLALLTPSKVTGAGLKHVRSLRGLQRLEMSPILFAMTDAHMAEIGTIKSLVTLQVPFISGITDAGVGHLRGLTELRHLHLGGAAVTAKGIASLEELPSLEAVWISGGKITDEGLRSLSKVKNLVWLALPSPSGPSFTFNELQALKKARPTLEYRIGGAGFGTGSYSAGFYRMPDPFERRWLP